MTQNLNMNTYNISNAGSIGSSSLATGAISSSSLATGAITSTSVSSSGTITGNLLNAPSITASQTFNLNAATGMTVGIGGTAIGVSTATANTFIVGQVVIANGTSNALFNGVSYTITGVSSSTVFQTNNPTAIPAFETSAGGTMTGSGTGTITATTITAPTVNATTEVNTNVIAATGSNTIRLKTSDATYSTYFSSAGSFPTGTQAGYFIHTLNTGTNHYSYSNIGGSGTATPINYQASEYNYQGGASGATQILKLRSNNGFADRLTPTAYQIQIPSSVGSLNMGAFYTAGVGFTSAIQSWDSSSGGVAQQLLINPLGGEVQLGLTSQLTTGNGNIVANAAGATISLYATNNGSIFSIARSGGIIGFYTNNGGGNGGQFNSVNIQSFASGGVQAGYMDIRHDNGVSAGAVFTQFVYNGVAIGSITQFGTTEVRFNTTSDYRLKSNIKPIDTSLLQKLKPCSFTWIQDNRDAIGFIAHEFAEVFPDDVINQKDEVDESGKPKYQQMSSSVCIPLLVSCVQEQQQRISSLEAHVQDQQQRISSLEAQLASLKAIVDSLVAGRV
jgi:hypothetical protein